MLSSRVEVGPATEPGILIDGKTLKELIDNAWDAAAENVHISLLEPMSDVPIVISNDSFGMTRAEFESHYLVIARDRRCWCRRQTYPHCRFQLAQLKTFEILTACGFEITDVGHRKPATLAQKLFAANRDTGHYLHN